MQTNNGHITDEVEPGCASIDAQIAMYRKMRLIRRFEETIKDLRATNEIDGVIHLYIGEEAVAVGVCSEASQGGRAHKYPSWSRPLHRQGSRS